MNKMKQMLASMRSKTLVKSWVYVPDNYQVKMNTVKVFGITVWKGSELVERRPVQLGNPGSVNPCPACGGPRKNGECPAHGKR